MSVLLPTSIGDAIDRMTILEIKGEKISDPAKRQNVLVELELVRKALAASVERNAQMDDLARQLKAVNAELWDVEDAIRECERHRDFGGEFVRLARSVYRTNDRRAQLKRDINLLAGSAIVEEKAYSDYGAGAA
ncbi:MAG TPA: DUF6165 family protein [Rhizomicrobium sp.]|nr:DUF6165 family protein [Rhizomicrobium sp.]